MLIIIMVSITGVAAAQAPVIPCEFYGTVMINGEPAPVGTLITVKIDGAECGSITTTETGQYGGTGTFDKRLVVQGTGDTEGMTATFYINGVPASPEALWNTGGSKQHGISITTESSNEERTFKDGASGSSSPDSNTYSGNTTSTGDSPDTGTSTDTTVIDETESAAKAAPETTQTPISEETGEQTPAITAPDKEIFGIPGFKGIFAVFAVFIIYYMRRGKK